MSQAALLNLRQNCNSIMNWWEHITKVTGQNQRTDAIQFTVYMAWDLWKWAFDNKATTAEQLIQLIQKAYGKIQAEPIWTTRDTCCCRTATMAGAPICPAWDFYSIQTVNLFQLIFFSLVWDFIRKYFVISYNGRGPAELAQKMNSVTQPCEDSLSWKAVF